MKYGLLAAAFIIFSIFSCSYDFDPDDNQTLQASNESGSLLKEETIATQVIELRLIVHYLNEEITEAEKAMIRKDFGNKFTIYKVIPSDKCRLVDLWIVNKAEHERSCKAPCSDDDVDTHPECCDSIFNGIYKDCF